MPQGADRRVRPQPEQIPHTNDHCPSGRHQPHWGMDAIELRFAECDAARPGGWEIPLQVTLHGLSSNRVPKSGVGGEPKGLTLTTRITTYDEFILMTPAFYLPVACPNS